MFVLPNWSIYLSIYLSIGILRSKEFEFGMEWVPEPPEALASDVMRVHEYVYLHRLEELCNSLKDGEHYHLDTDTLLNNRSYTVSLLAG